MDKNVEPGHVAGETARGSFDGPHEETLKLGAFKKIHGDLRSRHKLVHRINPIHRIVTKLLEGILHPPGTGRTIAIFPKGSPPPLLIFFEKIEIGLRIILGEAGDLIVSLLHILIGKLLFARNRIDAPGRIAYITGPIRINHPFILVGENIFEAILS